MLKILDEQEQATRGLVRDTGAVFSALSARQGQLRGLISNSNRVFETTADRDRQLADTFVAFPTFLRETRDHHAPALALRRRHQPADHPAASRRARAVAHAREPGQRGPRPRGRAPRPRRRSSAPRAGACPRCEQILDDARPVLERPAPTSGRSSRSPTTSACTSARSPPSSPTARPRSRPATRLGALKYLRTTNPLNPESLAAYSRRLPTNRSNPYAEPGANDQIAGGLPVFGTYLCQSGGSPQVPAPSALLPAQLQGLIQQFVFTATGPTAPPCREQAPLGRLVGQPGKYPQLGTLPSPDE